LFRSSRSPTAVTTTYQMKHKEWMDIGWGTWYFFDTPGLGCASISETSIIKEYKKAMKVAIGINAFIYVINAAERFKKEDDDTFRIFARQFGRKAFDHGFIAFSHSDMIDDEQKFIKEFKSIPKTKTMLKAFHNRYVMVNTTDMKDEKTLESVCTLIEALPGVYWSLYFYVQQMIIKKELATEEKKKKDAEEELAKKERHIQELKTQIVSPSSSSKPPAQFVNLGNGTHVLSPGNWSFPNGISYCSVNNIKVFITVSSISISS